MQLFKSTNINFIGNRNKAFIFSGILFAISIASLIYHKGPNLSIDFVGGTIIQLKFEKSISQDLSKLKAIISELNFGQPEIKTIGKEIENEVQIMVEKKAEGTMVGEEIKRIIKEKYSENAFQLRKEEKVGPKIGKELKRNGLLAIFLSLLVIVAYIAMRFHLPFGVAAVVALFHDVIITIGVFSVLDAEVSLPIVAAILFIIGYSLNDTIVVFDRIRENLSSPGSKKSFEDKLNHSINQCLSRTIITSLTTLAVVASIFGFFFNSGDVLKYFSGALLTGVLAGTYSSIFIATPVLIFWNKKWPIK